MVVAWCVKAVEVWQTHGYLEIIGRESEQK